MGNQTQRELLDSIAQAAQVVCERRGEHSAALWAVSDFLEGLKGLVPFRDSEKLDGNAYLVVARQKPEELSDDGWGLFLEFDGEGKGSKRLKAFQSPPESMVAAVRRLPEFLPQYLKKLQEAGGSKLTLAIAKELVNGIPSL